MRWGTNCNKGLGTHWIDVHVMGWINVMMNLGFCMSMELSFRVLHRQSLSILFLFLFYNMCLLNLMFSPSVVHLLLQCAFEFGCCVEKYFAYFDVHVSSPFAQVLSLTCLASCCSYVKFLLQEFLCEGVCTKRNIWHESRLCRTKRKPKWSQSSGIMWKSLLEPM